MEPISSIHRTIGIILGAFTIIGVGGITFISERAPVSAPLAQTTPITVPVVTTLVIPAVTTKAPAASTGVTTKTTYVRKCSGNDDDQVCVNVPVTTTTKSPAPTPTATVTTTPPPATVPKQTASVYRDGTYSATGSYGSPGGEDQIAVTLTLTNDIITSVSVTPAAGDRTSQRYQNYFISGYKQYVIGQNIAGVNLTYISGSSLTPIGFNDAISQIKAQAKA